MLTKDNIRTEVIALRAQADEIAAKADAETRDLTPIETAQLETINSKARELRARWEQAKTDQRVLADARALVEEIGGPLEHDSPAGGRKSDNPTARRAAWAKDAARHVENALMPGTDGQKAFVSGTIGVPSPIEPDVVANPRLATRILDLIDARGLRDGSGIGGNSFTFLRQTARTNNAAVVADGATKPTSVFTVAEIEDRVRVIAHLSEAIPKRYFDDHAGLQDFLDAEMSYGLYLALEAEVVSGDGTGEHLTGILNTSGIQTVAWSTDLLTTARKAVTSMQVNGVVPTAWALHPGDLEKIDLLREGSGTGQYLVGQPGSGAPTALWDIPRVPSTAVPPGVGILADWKQAELVVREDAVLAVDAGGTLFDKNQVKFRLEGRYGLAVKRPVSFASVDLTA